MKANCHNIMFPTTTSRLSTRGFLILCRSTLSTGKERINADTVVLVFFSSKIICAKCGATFCPRPWHSTSYNNSVWQCRNRYSAVKCKTTNIYNKLLFYVLHDVARKKIVAKDIRMAIVEFAAEVVGADKLAAIECYMDDFESMSAWKMLSNADDLSFVIDRVLFKPDRSIEVLWLDDSVDGYEIPRYTPKGGISMI